jgi:hypothetical protein
MRIIFICFASIVLLLISCKPAAEEVYKLKAGVPLSYTFYVNLAGVTDEYSAFYEYDSIRKINLYVFDSIPAREVTITFVSLLTDDYEKTIQLNQDTTILFESMQYDAFVQGEFEDVFNMVLNAKDTLYIGTQSHGCSSFSGKIKIFKIDTTYQILISTLGQPVETITYSLPEGTFRELFKVYLYDCRKLLPRPTIQELMLRSTICTGIYMRKGDTIYTLPDPSYWNGLDTFKKAIVETYQKIERKENGWDTLFVKNKKE